MADELIRLDTTIIGIDSLINKAPTADEAKVLFTVKDVIYRQQRYFADVQPVNHGRWSECFTDMYHYSGICSVCGKASIKTLTESLYAFCPNCGARMDLKEGDTE